MKPKINAWNSAKFCWLNKCRKSDRISPKQKRKFIFYIPFKTAVCFMKGYLLFLLFRTIILKIVQTLACIMHLNLIPARGGFRWKAQTCRWTPHEWPIVRQICYHFQTSWLAQVVSPWRTCWVFWGITQINDTNLRKKKRRGYTHNFSLRMARNSSNQYRTRCLGRYGWGRTRIGCWRRKTVVTNQARNWTVNHRIHIRTYTNP